MENETAFKSDLVLSNGSSDHGCEAVQALFAPEYQRLLFVDVIAALVSIWPNLVFLCVIWKVRIFCPDLRMVLANFSVVLIWYAIGDIVKVVNNLMIPPCGFRIKIRTCKIFDSLTVSIAIPNIVFSFLALCIQRLYANLRYKNYDKTHMNWLPCVLIVLAWGAAAVVQCNDAPSLPEDGFVPVCMSLYMPRSSALFYADCVAEFSIIGLAITVYFYTRFISNKMAFNRAQCDLAARFQVNQNSRVNSMLLPSITLQIISHVPNFVFLAAICGIWDVSIRTKLLLYRTTSIWRLLYATAHPILGFCLNEHLRKELLKSKLGMLFAWAGLQNKPFKNANVVTGAHQTTHFNYLDKLWDKTNRSRTLTAKVMIKMKQLKM